MRDENSQPEGYRDEWEDLPSSADASLYAKDRILNAFLEEALAGVSPPDFSGRIAATLAERRKAPSQVLAPIIAKQARTDRVSLATHSLATGVKKRAGSPWLSRFAMALSVGTIAAVATLYVAFRSGVFDGGPVAAPDAGADRTPTKRRDRQSIPNSHSATLAETDRRPVKPIEGASDAPPPFPIDGESHEATPGESPSSRYASAEPKPDEAVIAAVDDEIRRRWQENKVTPAESATEAEWCRRAFLRLVGRIPTVEELQAFINAAPPQESNAIDRTAYRAKLVDELLGLTPEGRRRYGEEYARHWSNYWTSLLIGRTGGLEPGSLANREAFQAYLHEAIASDTPLNKLAFDLVAATGSNTPGAADYNGAVNFLLGNMQEGDKMTLATARTSRVFLGQQLQCAQCHAHDADQIDQDAFWAMNSFFRQTASERASDGSAIRLVNRDFSGEGRQPNPRDAEVYYEDPRGALKAAWPQFIDGSKISPSGLVAEVDRRRELAKKIAASEDLPRATVNRLWSHFLGFGFTQPVDDMGAHREVSHPAALEALAEQFVAHDYDLRRLSRWIALSEPFGLSSKPPASGLKAEQVADFSSSGEPLFGRYYMRQMQPEEVYNSLLIAAGRHPQDAATEGAQQAWLSQFARRLDTDDGGEINAFDGAVHQSLAIMNGPLMRQAASPEESALLSRVAGSSLSLDEKIKHLFAAAIARSPTDKELELARELYAAHPDNSAAGLQDLWWALLNSNEFILDH